MAYNSEEEKKLATTVDEHLTQKPGEFSWDKQQLLDDTTSKWMNREDFSYDYANDPMYQQYKEQYSALGKLAMQDTMGQATALTGGYANSYAQTAGQQAYQQYMDKLNSMMPELYSMARSNYDAEGQQLYNEIALLEGQRSQAYGEWQNDVADWQNYLSFLYQQERDAVADAQWQKQYNLSATKTYDESNKETEEDYYKQTLTALKEKKMAGESADSVKAFLEELRDEKYISKNEYSALLNRYVGNQL